MAGHRATHAAPTRTPGGGGRAEPRRHPYGSAGRAADAGDQRRARATRAAARVGDGGWSYEHRRRGAAPAWRGAGDLHGVAASAPTRPPRALRGALPPRRLRTTRGTRASVADGSLARCAWRLSLGRSVARARR